VETEISCLHDELPRIRLVENSDNAAVESFFSSLKKEKIRR